MKKITAAAQRFEPASQAAINCRTTRRLALWCVLLCAIVQLLIDESWTNVLSALIVAIISAVTFHLVIRGSIFRELPLPALIVLGFNFSTMSGALIAQTLSLRALTYNLQVPLITFALCALFQISLLIALFVLLSSSTLRLTVRTINRRVFKKMGIMQAPSPVQLWIMGLIGSMAMLWSATNTVGDMEQYGDVGAKFIAGMSYLAFAPFIIPVLDKIFPMSRSSTTVKASKWLLFGYFFLLVLIAIVRNSRGTFMIGIANLGVAVLLLLFVGQLRVTKRLRRSLLMGAVLLMMIAPIMADLAIAMVVVRGERTNASATELVTLTFTAFNDKPELERYRKAVAVTAGAGSYDENYLANPFMARFVNTKFFDNTLSYADVRAGERSNELWGVTLEKIGALLPTPIINGLGININKENLQFSMGDALYNAQTGGGVGGYMTGSPIGHGIGLMGPFIFIAVIPIFLLAFVALQSLTVSTASFVIISPVILLQLMSVYALAAGDSLLDPISLMLRTLPQNILIYWMIFHMTLWVTSLRLRKSRTIKNIKSTAQN